MFTVWIAEHGLPLDRHRVDEMLQILRLTLFKQIPVHLKTSGHASYVGAVPSRGIPQQVLPCRGRAPKQNRTVFPPHIPRGVSVQRALCARTTGEICACAARDVRSGRRANAGAQSLGKGPSRRGGVQELGDEAREVVVLETLDGRVRPTALVKIREALSTRSVRVGRKTSSHQCENHCLFQRSDRHSGGAAPTVWHRGGPRVRYRATRQWRVPAAASFDDRE